MVTCGRAPGSPIPMPSRHLGHEACLESGGSNVPQRGQAAVSVIMHAAPRRIGFANQRVRIRSYTVDGRGLPEFLKDRERRSRILLLRSSRLLEGRKETLQFIVDVRFPVDNPSPNQVLITGVREGWVDPED